MDLRFWKKLWPWKQIAKMEHEMKDLRTAANMTEGSAALEQEKRITTLESSSVQIWKEIRLLQESVETAEALLVVQHNDIEKLKEFERKVKLVLKTGSFEFDGDVLTQLLSDSKPVTVKED